VPPALFNEWINSNPSYERKERMSILDGINTATDIIEDDSDRVRGDGFKPIPSQICDCTIKHAYLDLASSGAIGVRVALVAPDGTVINDLQWITSGTKKGCRPYFFERDRETGKLTDKKRPLPGFSMINDLVSVVTGYPIFKKGTEKINVKTEKRTIKVYNYDKKAEVPTEVEMLVDLLGKQVGVAIMSCIRDREAKDAATGKYVPTGKIVKKNEVEKYLHAKDHFTLIELKGKVPEPVFKKTWLEKWEGKIDDTSTAGANAGVSGTPVASGEQAPQSSIFAKTE